MPPAKGQSETVDGRPLGPDFLRPDGSRLRGPADARFSCSQASLAYGAQVASRFVRDDCVGAGRVRNP